MIISEWPSRPGLNPDNIYYKCSNRQVRALRNKAKKLSAHRNLVFFKCWNLINEYMYFPGFFFRTLPAKHVGKIAAQMRQHNINALLIVGGFEVCHRQLLSREASPILSFRSLYDLNLPTSKQCDSSLSQRTSIWLHIFMMENLNHSGESKYRQQHTS